MIEEAEVRSSAASTKAQKVWGGGFAVFAKVTYNSEYINQGRQDTITNIYVHEAQHTAMGKLWNQSLLKLSDRARIFRCDQE